MLVAEMLFENHPKASVGELTRMRSQLVSGPALAEIARELDLGDQLLLGPGELKSGGYRRDSILADAFEALLAAVYIDSGWEACRGTVRTLFAQRASTVRSPEKDAKTRLQELLQGRGLPLPVYHLAGEHGEDHAKEFDVECVLVDPPLREPGRDTNRRAAEQIAAAGMLARLEERFAHVD
jgi:ribonuclease-3